MRPRLAHRMRAGPLVLDMTGHGPEASIVFDLENGHRPGTIIRYQYEPLARIEFDVCWLNPS